MNDLKKLIEHEFEHCLEWSTADKSIVTTTSAKLFAEHVAKIYADHVAGARKMVAAAQGEPVECSACHGKGYRVAPLAIMLSCPLCKGSGIYTAPQPAEQQPTISDEIPARMTFGGPNRFTTAEQKPAPDVEALVEALERIAQLPMNSCSTENDYRLSAAKAIALAAVRDYRKGGDAP